MGNDFGQGDRIRDLVRDSGQGDFGQGLVRDLGPILWTVSDRVSEWPVESAEANFSETDVVVSDPDKVLYTGIWVLDYLFLFLFYFYFFIFGGEAGGGVVGE